RMITTLDSAAMGETLKRLLKSEMALKGVDYRALSARLAELGIHQSEANLRMKISRGTLGASLFVSIMLALGVRQIDMARVEECLTEVAQTASTAFAREVQRP
ncbi:MAG: DUF6471 domain-containing protein, partial [Pseudomonadota bacterium]